MRHLSAFVETVRCGSLKAASERVFLTQPAISKTLKDLEAGRMVTLPIATSTMAGPVGILVRSEEDPTPTIRLFRQALLESRNRAEVQ